ncbi:MAG: hypothetical protein AAGA99_11370, partial [Actinomycetota bacterium]
MTTPRTTRTRFAAGLLAVGALTLAACGGDSDSDSSAAAAPPPTTAAAAPAVNAEIAVTAGTSSLGDILVGEDGLTVYGFTNDIDARPTCFDACADAWPPVLVGPDWNVGPDLDLGIFATIDRGDGTTQLVAGKWPLYYFAGDAAPGDVNGQGSGDVWFAVDLDGRLIEGGPAEGASESEAAEAPTAAVVSTGDTAIGEVLVDEAGLTLYGFTEDVDAVPTCDGACADAWPPVILDSAELPPDLDPEIFSVVERSDGSLQLAAGIWPLYRFAGDAAPGDVNGQNSGDVWFAATPTGGLIREGAEAEAEAAAPAAEEITAPVTTAQTELGEALVDADGLTLYGFLEDVDATPTCAGACADAWPPVIIEGTEVPAGLDPEVFSVVRREDGDWQLVAGIWPLYTFAGDAAPGDVNGQGSGDTWFVATPEGGLIRDVAAAADT